MTKVLLVEDDNNLREIYEARLAAEGYDIVTAKDGEDALATAKQHKPELIISDVMMPRISGFEMLDILRNTDGLKNVKIIMLTALGQAEDKDRAEHLGADRYLVKSQVTLEDIVKAAQDLISDNSAAAAAPESTSSQSTDASTNVQEVPETSNPSIPAEVPVPTPVEVQDTATPAELEVTPSPVETVVSQNMPSIPLPPADPVAPSIQIPVIAPSTDQQATDNPVAVIPQVQPDPQQATDSAATTPTIGTPSDPATPIPAVTDAQSKVQEEAEVEKQIEQFVESNPITTEAEAPAEVAPEAPETTTTTTTDQDNASIINSAAEQLSTEAVPALQAPVDVPETTVTTMLEEYDDESSGSTQIPGKKVIQPLNEDLDKADLATLLAQEETKANDEKGITAEPVVSSAESPANSTQEQTVPPLSINSSGQTSGSVFKPQSDSDDSFNAL